MNYTIFKLKFTKKYYIFFHTLAIIRCIYDVKLLNNLH